MWTHDIFFEEPNIPGEESELSQMHVILTLCYMYIHIVYRP
jgi:hypothetical protein